MIKVLVVDDSGFMREALVQIIESDNEFEVIGTASDGKEAIRKIPGLRPDVVLLDIEMPVMDGLAALAHIMARHPLPVVMLSGIGKHDASLAVKSLELGAIDFLAKPSGVISYDIDKMRDEIIRKLKVASGVNVKSIRFNLPSPPLSSRKQIVVIGASTGGLLAVATVLSGLRRDISAAVVVVQHLDADFMPAFVDRLKWATTLDVSIAGRDDAVSSGRVLVAPGGCHTGIKNHDGEKRIYLGEAAPADSLSPSVDFSMESAANAYGDCAIGVILTGVGDDGVKGMRAIKEAGGRTMAEDSSTCVVYGMPKAAIDAGYVDEVVPLFMMANAILRMTGVTGDA